MAENKNTESTALAIQNSEQSNTDQIDNILQLNNDCLMLIMKKLKPIDLCAVAETCKRLKFVADDEFKRRYRKSYGIPQVTIEFKDHRRILKNFGHLVTAGSCVINVIEIFMSKKQILFAFKWFEKYCAETLRELKIIGFEESDLSPSAMRLIPKLQRIDLMIPVPEQMLQNALLNCNELVELNFFLYDGPFHFNAHRFPHLQKLSNRVRLNGETDFHKIETFFQHHTKLTNLRTQFLCDEDRGEHAIDFTFLKHLPELQKLELILVGAPVVGIEAFGYLKNLQEFSVDDSSDKRTDALIFENLASVDCLVKLVLGFPEISHLTVAIGRFKKLAKLEISSHNADPHHSFNNVNISGLAQLCNSSITELEIGCIKLLEPESILNVIRNLKEVKIMKLFCEVDSIEKICEDLVKVCSSQNRKIIIVLEAEILTEVDFDFDFIKKHNEEHRAFVEVRAEINAVVIE